MNTLQAFLADATLQASADLETALLRLPEDKRDWRAGGQARSALDMIAECAILNGLTADDIPQRAIADFDRAAYEAEKARLRQDPDMLLALLRDNSARVAQVIRATPDADLEGEIPSPWGPMAATENASYPYWNMKYHEGQINFIASMLGCLK